MSTRITAWTSDLTFSIEKDVTISKMRYLSLILCAVLSIGIGAFAQSDYESRLTVYAGATIFPDPEYDSVSLVEFPFSLSRNQFEFFRPDGPDSSLYSRIFAQVVLINTFGERIDSVSTYFSVRTSKRAEAMQTGVRLFNKLILFVKPGVYSARVEVIDAVSKRSGEAFIDKIIVEPPVKDRLSLSDPMLAFSISSQDDYDSTTSNIRLIRNGFLIVPNPVSMFSAKDTIIYLYGELYNLDINEQSTDKLRLEFDIIRDETVYRKLGMRNIIKQGSTMSYVESFDIKEWPTGLYSLRVAAFDSSINQSDTGNVLFRIISHRELAKEVRRYRSNDPYDELLLEEKCNLIYFLLSMPERETLNRLTEVGKESFLDQFWKEHPTVSNPRADISMTRKELISCYRYANAHFSTNIKKDNGWSTDQGRVILTYGPWEEIEAREVPIKRSPFEVWWYHSQREGMVFVFEESHGTYRLVHSNVNGEIFNDEWAAILKSEIMESEPDLVPDIDGP